MLDIAGVSQGVTLPPKDNKGSGITHGMHREARQAVARLSYIVVGNSRDTSCSRSSSDTRQVDGRKQREMVKSFGVV